VNEPSLINAIMPGTQKPKENDRIIQNNWKMKLQTGNMETAARNQMAETDNYRRNQNIKGW
jgi:hypothetical protein